MTIKIEIDTKDPKTRKFLIAIAVVIGIVIIGYAFSVINHEKVVVGENRTNGGNNTGTNGETAKNNETSTQNIGNEVKTNNGNELRFIVVGDPHIKSTSGSSSRGNARLAQVVNLIDQSNVDFAVFLGDIADDGKPKTYDIAKNIIANITKPYYTVAGNHDVLLGPTNFEAAFGSMEHLENVKGYQLIFPGIYFEGPNKLHWSFNFDIANKSMPTLVFIHGPTIEPPVDATTCNWGKDFFGYGQSMQPELNKFPGLIAEYTGHVHYDTDQTINGIRYVTVNGLIDKAGGCENAGPSQYVGYSRIKDGKADYMLIDYNSQFRDPFPDN
jgi:predicted phosphodiesterase